MFRFVRSYETACVRQEREVWQDPRRAGCAAAKEVVAKHPQGVHHHQKFKDVRQVGWLGCSELAALVGHRVISLVVGLRENGIGCFRGWREGGGLLDLD